MQGFRFIKYVPPQKGEASFENLFDIFMQLLNYTSGDVAEALDWMTQLDNQYGFTNGAYGMGNFLDDLQEKGYLSSENNKGELNYKLTAKTEQVIRKNALEEIFGKLRKGDSGSHRTNHAGQSEEANGDMRSFEFGDSLEDINLNKSLQNAQINHGIDHFRLTENDLEIEQKEFKTNCATVLMIDISHSMILYGEDRITPAKKVAMALSELIMTKYPKDTLDIIVFGNDAWPVSIKELPYLKVGPYHTNTVAGLELAMDIFRKRKTPNKQIFMVTDGKPTCLKVGTKYYKNSFGLDRKVINKTMNLAAQCKRINIPITTFMIAQDPYLQQFVREFTQTNQGRAYYSSLDGLGEFLFEDFITNRKKHLK